MERYDFEFKAAQFEPVVAQPLVQVFLKLLSHGTMFVVLFKHFLEILDNFDVTGFLSTLYNAYTPALK